MNELIMDKVIEGNYNIRIPNLGIITLIKFKTKKVKHFAKIKKGDPILKIHLYSQITGEDNRTFVLDFDFTAKREYTRLLQKRFSNIADAIKESD